MSVTIIATFGTIKVSGIPRTFVNCLCECGVEFTARRDHVTRKKYPIQSCGCQQYKIGVRKAYNAKPDGEAAAKSVFNSYKNRCKTKKIPFEIDFDQFVSLTSKNCFYCNSAPEQEYSGYFKYGVRAGKKKLNGSYKYNGLDRIIPEEGYKLYNVRPCCKYCNSAKLDRTEEQFYEWIKNLSKNLGHF